MSYFVAEFDKLMSAHFQEKCEVLTVQNLKLCGIALDFYRLLAEKDELNPLDLEAQTKAKFEELKQLMGIKE